MTSPQSHPERSKAIDRIADALKSGGHNFQRRGSHIQASCPLHTDAKPSLSIDDGSRGSGPGALLNCHSADCEEREIAEALGLGYDELWDEPLHDCAECGKRTMQDPATGEWVHPYCAAKRDGRPIPRDHVAKRPPVKTRPKIGRLPRREIRPSETVVERETTVAEYDHTDDEGEVIAQSVRREKLVQVEGEPAPKTAKRFYQQFTDGKGGWGKKDVLPDGPVVPLYRLSAVRLSILAGEPVHLVEGHKDAEAIVAAGGEATTNIDGAKNLHREDTDQLAGAQVIVVCDRDLAGYRRGLAALELLDGVADSVEVVLPATTERKSDAYDHLQAKYGLDDFVPTDQDELQRLVILDRAALILTDVQSMPAEILAHEDLAEAATSDDDRSEHHRAADRWSTEIAKQQFQGKLVPLREELTKITGCTREEVRRLETIIGQVRRIAVEACGRRQLDVDHELATLLGLGDHEDPAELINPTPDNVVDFPKAEYRRNDPTHVIPMATATEFAYSLGDDGFERGVWMKSKSIPWTQIAELPYVHRRVIRRDGRGKRIGLQYQLSVHLDEKPQQFDLQTLKDGAWANHLGVELSQDQKVIAAVATAIIYAGKDAPEQEATPSIDPDTGKIVIPASIDQYFECAPVPVEEALDSWREIVDEVAKAPKMALTLGASAIAPFVHSLSDSHTVSLTGEPGQGKTVMLMLAAAIWGDSVTGNGSLYSSWNSTGQGLPRLLGTLRVLPVYRDETGLAGQSPEYWAQMAYQISEGTDRLRYDRVSDYSFDKPWWGILFSTGNEEFADGCSSGRYQGVPRRLVNLAGPFTLSKEHSEKLYRSKAPRGRRGLLERCYGHLGTQIAEQFDAVQAVDLLDEAAGTLDCPDSAELIGPLLELHVAGAMVVDKILGTGDKLTKAAAIGAQDYLDSWKPPAREAEQVIEMLMDAIGREPSAWPSVAEYAENLLPHANLEGNDNRHIQLPQAGVSRNLYGVISNDNTWVGIFTTAWNELFPPEQINKRLACRQLADDKILRVQDSRRRRDEYANQVSLSSSAGLGKSSGRFYQLYLPQLIITPDESNLPDSDVPDSDAPQPTLTDSGDNEIGGIETENGGQVAGESAGTKDALTREVAGIAGSEAMASRSVREAEEPSATSAPAAAVSRTVLVHAEGLVELDPAREPGTWTDRTGGVRERAWAKNTGPCEVCNLSCAVVVDGHRVHLPCFEQLLEGSSTNTLPGPTVPAPDVQPQTTDADSSAKGSRSQVEPKAQPSKQLRHGRGDARWAAPAAVLTDALAYVAGQDPVDWQATHLGELALLTKQLRLGYGGDRDRLPDPGQIWLTTQALEQLGLPTSLDWPDGRSLDNRDLAEEKLFTPIQLLPAVVEATRAGWQISTAKGNVRTWTRISHPELLPGGAYLVFAPWHPQPVTGFTDDPAITPADLANRLATFADAVGGPYVITPAITGVRLVERTRPARRDADAGVDDNSRRRKSLAVEKPELPPFLADRSDARFTGMELDFTWWRVWEQTERSNRAALTEEERGKAWVHGYDRKGSYLAVWERLDLGLEGLQHREGDSATWPGNEKPGFFLVDDWEWTEWGLPNPADAAGARVEDGRRWVTSHTLRQLKAHGIEPNVHESWSWDVTGSYLEQSAKIIKGGLKRAQDLPDEAWMRPLIKSVYTRTGGKFAAHRTNSAYHLHRPDWWFHIVAASRTAILYQLTKAFERTGSLPIAVDHDAVFYVSDEPDPAKAWPGDPKKLADERMGDWRPIGSAPLEHWGSKHLVDSLGSLGGKKGRSRFDFQQWRYSDAVADLTLNPGE